VTITFRPAVREHTPLIIGIGGPTKSGKTFSALRLAVGLAHGGPVAMINAEGPRGHQYADTFKYIAADLEAPFRPARYTDALQAATAVKPAVVIVDSASHMHDGPGGILEWHEEILDRIAGKDYDKRQRATFAAWVEPKQAENQFIYQMLSMRIPIILCFRAKEKIKIVNGKPVELGWQPIVGERVAFETIFTLMLPPHSKGAPDLSISEMREPFDAIVPKGKQIDEDLGRRLAEWAAGSTKGKPKPAPAQPTAPTPAASDGDEEHPLFSPKADHVAAIELARAGLGKPIPGPIWAALCQEVCGCAPEELEKADAAALADLHGLLKGIKAKDKGSIQRANAIAMKAKAGTPR
jgi:hypothetical protein